MDLIWTKNTGNFVQLSFFSVNYKYQIYFLWTFLTPPVTEVFNVEPPQLDLAYLELNEAPIVKKTGDIFDDVKFFRKSYRWKIRIAMLCESRPLLFLYMYSLSLSKKYTHLNVEKLIFHSVPSVSALYIAMYCYV